LLDQAGRTRLAICLDVRNSIACTTGSKAGRFA
jgi:hypothetical protein